MVNDGQGEAEAEGGEAVGGGLKAIFDEGQGGEGGEQRGEAADVGRGGLRPKGGGHAEDERGDQPRQVRGREPVHGAVDEDEGEGGGDGGEQVEAIGIGAHAGEADEQPTEEGVQGKAGRVRHTEQRHNRLKFAPVGGQEAGGKGENVEREGEAEEEDGRPAAGEAGGVKREA